MMEIECIWGQEDGWFHTLTRERQIKLLAHYRIRMDPEGKRFKSKRAKGKDFWGF